MDSNTISFRQTECNCVTKQRELVRLTWHAFNESAHPSRRTGHRNPSFGTRERATSEPPQNTIASSDIDRDPLEWGLLDDTREVVHISRARTL